MGWEQGTRGRSDILSESRQIADMLDSGNIGIAERALNDSLNSFRNGYPGDQQRLLNAVDAQDRKGVGADLQIFQDPNGRVSWQILENQPGLYSGAYGCGDARNRSYCQSNRMDSYNPYYENRSVVMVERSDPAGRIVEGIAIGVGSAIGREIMHDVLGGHRDYYDRHRSSHPRYEHHRGERVHYGPMRPIIIHNHYNNSSDNYNQHQGRGNQGRDNHNRDNHNRDNHNRDNYGHHQGRDHRR